MPCGQGVSPPVAQPFVNVPITPCPDLGAPDLDGGTDAAPLAGIVVVYPSAALPSTLTCAGGVPPGTVTGFDVVPADPALPSKTSTPCPSSSQDAAYPGLVPGRCYAFRVTAHVEAGDAGSAAGPATTLSSWCVGTPVEGITVSAMCDPVVPADPDAGADGGVDTGSPCP